VRDLYRRDGPTDGISHRGRRNRSGRWSRLSQAVRWPWLTPFEVTLFCWLGVLLVVMALTAFTWRISTG